MTNVQKVSKLALEFEKVEKIDIGSAQKLLRFLDEASDTALTLIVSARVKFLWMPAALRLKNRGVN